MHLKLVSESRWKVFAVAKDDDECELLDFLYSIPPNMEKSKTALLALFDHVADNGPRDLPDKLSHQIDSGIWEFIKGRIRVLWFYDEGKIVICSHGFIKKTQTTPKSEIDKVTKIKSKYIDCKNEGSIELS
ncbi:MAG: type II toxin-antitoxin system RelE/ParE family toxin [Methylococcaceae bacterium]